MSSPTTANTSRAPLETQRGELHRTIGFWGLSFVSLGSIIGSGWLLGALTAASLAGGGGSLITWILAALMLSLLALIHADLGAAYPIAGGTARYPFFAFGKFIGFNAGWATYLQAVAIAPLEVQASLSYLNSVKSIKDSVQLVKANGTLTVAGLLIAIAAMLVFMAINLAGAKLMSDSNTGVVLWKIFVPLLTVIVLIIISFHSGNFTAGGGFAPTGAHGIFAALPAGVVFALQGFEQATQMAGEAKNPQKDLAKAILTAMAIGACLYIALEVAFVGALNPHSIGNWEHPIGKGDYGPYYTLAMNAGVGWLAVLLIIDAVVSPSGTGLVYLGTTSRIAYAMGMPMSMTRTNKKGVPVRSIIAATVLGMLCLAPLPSWKQLVSLITNATAIMYMFAPIALAALYKSDPNRHHPYRIPAPAITLPVGFCFANLIVYWGGFEPTWKIAIGMAIGQVLFVLTELKRGHAGELKAGALGFVWFWAWQIIMVIVGDLGRYGGNNTLPNYWDSLLAIVIGLVFYYAALKFLPLQREHVEPAIDNELAQESAEPLFA